MFVRRGKNGAIADHNTLWSVVVDANLNQLPWKNRGRDLIGDKLAVQRVLPLITSPALRVFLPLGAFLNVTKLVRLWHITQGFFFLLTAFLSSNGAIHDPSYIYKT